jgi:hypothetical protein
MTEKIARVAAALMTLDDEHMEKHPYIIEMLVRSRTSFGNIR